MGLLDQLWDDTVAGPRPENGLGKLRKHKTFSFPSTSSKESDVMRSTGGEGSGEETMRVTRSIMIGKPAGYQVAGSPPISPAGSTPPVSPFSGSRESFLFRRRNEKGAATIGTRSTSSSYDGV